MITALGEVWHPEHFVCVECKMELSTTGFFEREGRPYCDEDYHQLFSPRCAYCKGPIVQVRKLCFCLLCVDDDKCFPLTNQNLYHTLRAHICSCFLIHTPTCSVMTLNPFIYTVIFWRLDEDIQWYLVKFSWHFPPVIFINKAQNHVGILQSGLTLQPKVIYQNLMLLIHFMW